MPPRGVIDSSSASPQKFPFSLEECLHYDADPVWRRGVGYNRLGIRTYLPVLVCGTCSEPLAPALTQRQREDAALEERVRRQVSREIAEYRPMFTTRARWARMTTANEVYEDTRALLSRVAWWPLTDGGEQV